jgi:membrane protein implicated in regulation of membrane protease activity
MKAHAEMKILTARHFLFYMGMACLAAAVVWATAEVLSWSNGLTFAAVVAVETLVSVTALRESLFAPLASKRASTTAPTLSSAR